MVACVARAVLATLCLPPCAAGHLQPGAQMLVGAGGAAALQAVCGGAGPEAAPRAGCCKAAAVWAPLILGTYQPL